MPLFEYKCQDCGTQFETVVFDRRRIVTCKKCHSSRVQKLISVFAVAGGSRSETAALEPGPCTSCGAPQRGTCGLDD
jgi:putative FmdB family regulatory protein